MDSSKKDHSFLIWLVIFILCLVLGFMITIGVFSGGINSTGSNTKTYSSLKAAQNSASIEIDMPSGIDTSGITEVRVLSGQLLEALAPEQYVLKAAGFVDVLADPLGMYSSCDTDYMYNVLDNEIIFVRYRDGYEGYENTVILNWCTNKTSYGMVLANKLTFEDCLELLGLNKESISEYRSVSSNDEVGQTETSDVQYREYIIDSEEKYKIELPVLSSKVSVWPYENYCLIFIDKNIALGIMFNDMGAAMDMLKDGEEMKASNGMVVRYPSENMMDTGTSLYSDMELILDNIEYIVSTVGPVDETD